MMRKSSVNSVSVKCCGAFFCLAEGAWGHIINRKGCADKCGSYIYSREQWAKSVWLTLCRCLHEHKVSKLAWRMPRGSKTPQLAVGSLVIERTHSETGWGKTLCKSCPATAEYKIKNHTGHQSKKAYKNLYEKTEKSAPDYPFGEWT